ncbi:FecCD family ABC transporter permease [Paenibacillus thalictri]|uniref:Iron ABC transporter permease n=1 Tax=Paenibacillus thalictri TaxID=2527873 RepID=A0A4Q9DUR6_9BACL|nr:iron ABC transporter permease [Paenibacillus thalictri]TBL80105.1 iron ABC transporter permease [Paenibacillus thalictri]
MANKHAVFFAVTAALFLVAVTASLCMGRYTMTPGELFQSIFSPASLQPGNAGATVIWSIRLPRVIVAAVIGAGLAVAGASLQAMFSNPLVSEHLLGVSSGAGFGAALGIYLFSQTVLIQGMAVIFGLLSMVIAYYISKKDGQVNILKLVLAGMITSSVFAALTSLIQYIADPEKQLPSILFWLMGSLAGATMKDVTSTIPLIVLGIALIWKLRWQLNIISLKEEEAVSLGINLKRIRIAVILATTVITALAVATCGMISFVGLIVPHFARMVVGPNNKILIPASIALGAVFMVAVDTTARTLTSAEIPLSVLTALIGAPIFGYMLYKTGGAWSD